MAKDLVQKFMESAGHQQKTVFAAKLLEAMKKESCEKFASICKLLENDEGVSETTKACTHLLEDITLQLENLSDNISDVEDKDLPDEHSAMMDRMLCVISLQSYVFFLETGEERFLKKMVDQTPLGYYQLLELIQS